LDTNVPIKLAPMEMYLHDSTETFKFALHGELTADAVQSLEQAWITAMSILDGKEVLVDVSAVTAADAEGIQLLRRMTASGARMRAALPAHSEEILRSLGVSVTAPSRRSGWPWMIGLRRRFGLAR
jgi:ABC-type transporter Mla MlaB component